MTLECLTLAEVAVKLRKQRTWLYRHWQDLVKNQGFPPPIPGLGRDRVWHAGAIEAWLVSTWPEELRPKAAAGEGEDLQAVEDELIARARGGRAA